MDETWTLPELVEQVAGRLVVLPAPRNGQVRAVPDDRTIRYYGTIGLLDRPAAMRGRTALYGSRHLAQVVAIKRLQGAGKSLAEIQTLWPTLDDDTLARLSGVTLAPRARSTALAARDFWKRTPASTSTATAPAAVPHGAAAAAAPPPVELRVELAPGVVLSLAMPTEGVAMSPADVRAIRTAAASLVAELARRQLTPHAGEEEP